jgi:bisphosphoglycerate-dependent phosphoglycerate mutase family 1
MLGEGFASDSVPRFSPFLLLSCQINPTAPIQSIHLERSQRYRKLTPEQLDRSRAESLKDTAERIMPFWKSVIVPSIRAGNKCLVVSHANTIRTLIKHIDQISDEDIKGMTIPTGIPLLYRLDKNLRPVDPQVEMEFRYMVEPKGYVRAFDACLVGVIFCRLDSHR